MPTDRVAFHVTDRCTLDCRHCLRDPGRAPLDLPLAVAEKLLDEAVALYRIRHVSLTGGEPSLHPGLAPLLDAIAARGLTWNVVTSGHDFGRLVGMLEATPARRAALAEVDISLDGATEGIHDAIRGAGSWRAAMAAALACRAREIPFAIQMTVSALNDAEVEALGLHAAQLGAARVSFAMTQATGTPEDERLWRPAAAWRATRGRIVQLGAALAIPVTLAEGWPIEQPFHACASLRLELLHVDPRGRLGLCCMHSGVPGGEGGVVADLATSSLLDGSRRLLELIHRLRRERLDALAGGAAGAWDLFPCNRCLADFGRPHWTEAGSAGTRARRQRRGGAGPGEEAA